MNRRTFLRSAAALATVAAAPSLARVANAAPAVQTDRMKIVSSLPMTGSSLTQTQTMVNSINLALEEVGNRAGRFTVEYEPLDDATPAAGKWDPGKEAENANRAVADPDVMVYIGTFNSGAAKVSIPILGSARLAMITPAATYPGLTKPEGAEPNEPDVYYPTGVRNFARVCQTDDVQGAIAAAWAQSLGFRSAYVLDDTELYGNGLAKVFVAEAKQRGIAVVSSNGDTEGIDPKAASYQSLANKIGAAKPDMVYFGGITQNNAGKLIKDLRDAGLTTPFMSDDGVYEEAFLKDAGDAAEGAYLTFGGVPPNKLTGAGAEWYSNYKRRFNSEPEAYASYAYEAIKVALDAIKRADTKDREAIRAAVMGTTDYNGLLGTWSFNANGDVSLKRMSGITVKGGKFEFVGTFTAT